MNLWAVSSEMWTVAMMTQPTSQSAAARARSSLWKRGYCADYIQFSLCIGSSLWNWDFLFFLQRHMCVCADIPAVVFTARYIHLYINFHEVVPSLCPPLPEFIKLWISTLSLAFTIQLFLSALKDYPLLSPLPELTKLWISTLFGGCCSNSFKCVQVLSVAASTFHIAVYEDSPSLGYGWVLSLAPLLALYEYSLLPPLLFTEFSVNYFTWLAGVVCVCVSVCMRACVCVCVCVCDVGCVCWARCPWMSIWLSMFSWFSTCIVSV